MARSVRRKGRLLQWHPSPTDRFDTGTRRSPCRRRACPRRRARCRAVRPCQPVRQWIDLPARRSSSAEPPLPPPGSIPLGRGPQAPCAFEWRGANGAVLAVHWFALSLGDRCQCRDRPLGLASFRRSSCFLSPRRCARVRGPDGRDRRLVVLDCWSRARAQAPNLSCKARHGRSSRLFRPCLR